MIWQQALFHPGSWDHLRGPDPFWDAYPGCRSRSTPRQSLARPPGCRNDVVLAEGMVTIGGGVTRCCAWWVAVAMFCGYCELWEPELIPMRG